jgi:hypothetical protein
VDQRSALFAKGAELGGVAEPAALIGFRKRDAGVLHAGETSFAELAITAWTSSQGLSFPSVYGFVYIARLSQVCFECQFFDHRVKILQRLFWAGSRRFHRASDLWFKNFCAPEKRFRRFAALSVFLWL